MMGRLEATQDRLIYDFRYADFVPADHLVRRINAALDLSWLRAEVKPFYAGEGRPSIDPELMIRMLIVGYCFGIRSERRLCEEVRVNLPINGFVGWRSTALCRIIRPSRKIDSAAFATAIYFGVCSSVWWLPESKRASSTARLSLWIQALSQSREGTEAHARSVRNRGKPKGFRSTPADRRRREIKIARGSLRALLL